MQEHESRVTTMLYLFWWKKWERKKQKLQKGKTESRMAGISSNHSLAGCPALSWYATNQKQQEAKSKMKNLKPVKLSSILHKAVSDMRAPSIIEIEIEGSELKYLQKSLNIVLWGGN